MGIRHTKKCRALPDLNSLLKSEDIVLFISENSKECFHCIELLKSLSLKPFLINLSYEANLSTLRQALFYLTGRYDVPLLFIKSHYFGSLSDLKKSISQGSFQSLLSNHKIQFSILT